MTVKPLSTALWGLLTVCALACSSPKDENTPSGITDTGSSTTADVGQLYSDSSSDLGLGSVDGAGATSDGVGGTGDAAPPTDANAGASDAVGTDSVTASDSGAADTSLSDATAANDGAASTDGSGGDTTTDVSGSADSATPPSNIGCSDGTREGFVDLGKYAKVAACQGAWTVAGIHHGTPACGREAGNSGKNAAGQGCNVEDLCSQGWHVCYGAKDVLERNALGCDGILEGGPAGPAFFLARTSSTGAFNCSQDSTKFGSPGTSNDLFGCGNLGCGLNLTTYPTCKPLNVASHDLCKGLRNDKNCGDWCSHLGKFPGEPNVWDCGNKSTLEANNVIKSDPTRQGGVLCCVDNVGTGP